MNQITPFSAIVRRELSRNVDLYTPLQVLSVKLEHRETRSDHLIDGVVQLAWSGRKETFMTELRARSSPKAVQEGIRILKEFSANGKNRLLILPYLSSAVIDLIKPEGISVLDLNGNYFIQTKNLLAIRLDRPNLYKDSQPIKQVFSGNSSIVGRFLLSKNKIYTSVNEIYKKIQELGGSEENNSISLPTVSKVLKRLEEELMIEKTRDKIKILQPEKLLYRLRDKYRAPKVTEELKLKMPSEFKNWSKVFSETFVFSGESSAQRYTATTPPQVQTIYVTDISSLLRTIPVQTYKEARFPNCILKETRDAFVYFRNRKEDGLWSSPIQCYLELSQLDKREREIAENMQKLILEPFQ